LGTFMRSSGMRGLASGASAKSGSAISSALGASALALPVERGLRDRADDGHDDVDDHDAGSGQVGQQPKSLLSVRRHGDRIPLVAQGVPQRFPYVVFVIDDEDRFVLHLTTALQRI